MLSVSEVSSDFVVEIEGWCVALAHNIELRNSQLSVRQDNFVLIALSTALS